MRRRRLNSRRSFLKPAYSPLQSAIPLLRKEKRGCARSSARRINGSSCCARQTFWPKWRSHWASSKRASRAWGEGNSRCKSFAVLVIFPWCGHPGYSVNSQKPMPLRTAWPLPLSNWFLDALIVESKPSHSIDAVWRRNYDHESHRNGNCCGDVFLLERCGTGADGCSGRCAEQQPGIGASRPGECFTGEWHGVQRCAEFANRFEE